MFRAAHILYAQVGVYKCPNTFMKIVVSRATFYDFQRVITFASDFEKIRYSSFRVSIFPLYLFKFALPFLALCTCNRFVIRYFELRKIYYLYVYVCPWSARGNCIGNE